MNTIRWLAVFVLCTLLNTITVYSQASDIRFEHITSEQGLSQSSVLCILQDRQGFMWFGTRDGLNRYDGARFKIFRSDPLDSNSLSDDYINALYEDDAGKLWIGTASGGITVYDPIDETFRRYRHDPTNDSSLSDDHINTFCRGPGNIIWVGTDGGGLSKITYSTDRVTGFPLVKFTTYRNKPGDLTSLSNDKVDALLEDNSGKLWVGTYGGGLNFFEPNSRKFVRCPNDAAQNHLVDASKVSALCKDDAGNLIVGFDGGVDLFNPKTGHFDDLLADTTIVRILRTTFVTSIVQHQDKTTWIATGKGLIQYMPNGKIVTIHTRIPPDSRTPTATYFYCLFLDHAANLWIGTDDGVSLRWKPSAAFQSYSHDSTNVNSLGHEGVWSFYEDSQNILWIGHYIGLDRLDKRNNIYTHYFHDPKDSNSVNYVYAIHEDRSGLFWLGTAGGGLVSLDRRANKLTSHRQEMSRQGELPNYSVNCIHEDQEGNLWLGMWYSGLVEAKVARGKIERVVSYQHDSQNPYSISNSTALAILEDPIGNFWVTTLDGLNYFDRRVGRFTAYRNDPHDSTSISNNTTISLFLDSSQTLWIGTAGGLNKLSLPIRGQARFERLTTRDGLPNNWIYGILPDSDGNLWLSTNLGISKFNPRLKTFRDYTAEDGLQSNEFNQGASYRNMQGEMFFGGVKGFSSFYPSQIKDNPILPPVVLTSFMKFNREAKLDSSIMHINTIILQHDESVFSFGFAALNYLKPRKNLYAYKMEGFDKGWVYCGTKHEATYTNLDPGEYIFHVKGSNNDGIWNETGTSVRVIILPPYWKTWWFRSLIVLALLVIVYGVYRYRVAQLIKVERLRLRIAGDLHDDVGSNLSSISLGSQLVLRQSNLDRDTRQLIEEIRENAAETAETMRDIVWLINPKNDQLEDLLLRMKDVAAQLLHGIEYSFQATDQSLPRIVDLSVRRNIFLIYKESINNIAKHAKATRVDISFIQSDGRLMLSIKDNGAGFDSANPRKGNGLAGFQRRAKAIHAIIHIESTPNAGTTVSLSVPIT